MKDLKRFFEEGVLFLKIIFFIAFAVSLLAAINGEFQHALIASWISLLTVCIIADEEIKEAKNTFSDGEKSEIECEYCGKPIPEYTDQWAVNLPEWRYACHTCFVKQY